MKVIVAGSRHWDCPEVVYLPLEMALFTAGARGEALTVVHGKCPTGADRWANVWTELQRVPVYVVDYPADWYGPCQPDCRHRPRRAGARCPAAGPRRNRLMIDENLDADYVVGFPLGESPGTRGCMDYAERRGLRVFNFGDMWRCAA